MRKYLESTALATMMLASLLPTVAAYANPVDGVVSAGAATITETGKNLDIHQSTDKAVIDWRSFDIGADEKTQFYQPNSSSITLNRINSGSPSQILGQLKANGNIVIVNGAGVLFGAGSQVDVNGLVATSSNVSNANFMAGNLNFDTPGNANASIINQGTITAQQAGLVGLVAPNVSNSGIITAKLGKVQLESGDRFSLDLYGDGLINVTASDAIQQQLVEHTGSINAEGGTVVLAAATGAQVVNSLVNIEGELTTASATQQGGKIIISGDVVSHTGTMDASGTKGGSVSVHANKIVNQGTIKANSSADVGGNIDIAFKDAYIDTQQAHLSATSASNDGGAISVVGDTGSHAFISGNYDVSSSAAKGGSVAITAKDGDLKLFGTQVHADGKTGGGKILVGGDFQGGGTLAHTATTGVNYATTLSANALDTGTGGNIVIWSDTTTLFGGHALAKGGATAGDGGHIEISSHDTLQIAGNAETNASATHGQAGDLLLDPKNIIVATGGINGGISSFEMVDPSTSPNGFGEQWSTYILSNGNVLATDEFDSFMASYGGAVLLFNGATGALISALYGNHADDRIGNGVFTELANSNFVLGSSLWDDGVHTDVGAITWFNGTTGVGGVIDATNSLVGSHDDDGVGLFTPTVLANGNYVLFNPYWDDGVHTDVGAVTWINGTTGLTGVVSASNSLVGSHDNDQVGYNGLTELTNGNFVTSTTYWNDGVHTEVGAATWVNGATGLTGIVSAANSLVGSHNSDHIGGGDPAVTALTNGNYVVTSPNWQDGVNGNVGAVTWGNGATGTSGLVNAGNSLVGSHSFDWVGWSGVKALANGNYVVGSEYWGGGFIRYGAATWGNGTTGTTGVVDATNSLLGSHGYDDVGGNIQVLGNGNYLVVTRYWDDGATADVGAVTWGSSTAGVSGTINSTNSLIGSHPNDQVGSWIFMFGNDYVVGSSEWNDGVHTAVGALTWGDGATGRFGVVDATNSLVGSHDYDNIGGNNIFQTGYDVIRLANGSYVVDSAGWDDGVHTDVGAVSWFSSGANMKGVVSAANSLVGSNDFDAVGYSGIYALASGNYVVGSTNWNDGVHTAVGAVTWGNGTTGTFGAVSAANSLVGSNDYDNIGSKITALTNGNYVTNSSAWDDGVHTNAGAVTWGNGVTGASGVVSAANSLVGSHDFDQVGDGDIVELANGNYVVRSQYWNDGTHAEVGAVTWGDGTTSTHGVISATNSLVGAHANDHVGSGDVLALANGNYAVTSSDVDNGAVVDTGAISFLSGLGTTVGVVDTTNSFMPGVASSFAALIGYDTVNGRYIVGSDTFHLYSVGTSGGSLGSYDSYGDQSTATVTLDPAFITAVLNAGTAVTLQASNDITINDAIIANNGSGNGGTLTLQAGRSILINDDITTDNGNLNIFANERAATGVVNAQRDAGAAVITMATGVQIDAGTGDVVIRMDNGIGNTNRGAGSITLTDITANTIFARNLNSTGDIILDSGALMATAASGDSIILASMRNFINNAGASVMNVAGTARWLSYSTKAVSDVDGSLVADFSLDACTYGGSCGALGSGNGFLYSFDPNAPVAGGNTSVPDTVLYVSQTPVDNIVQAPAAPSHDGSGQPLARGENKQPYLTANSKDGGATYSLFNGWITIAPELVELLGLDKAKI